MEDGYHVEVTKVVLPHAAPAASSEQKEERALQINVGRTVIGANAMATRAR
jgi:hypothetical protein